MPILFIIFIIVPLIEIWGFIKIGSIYGAGTTIFAILFTAILGVWLIRMQSLSTLMRSQKNLEKGQLPLQEMIEGPLLILCAVCLLTPGFFTDTLGFLGLIPPIRKNIALGILSKYLKPGVHVMNPQNKNENANANANANPNSTQYIQGKYRRLDNDDD